MPLTETERRALILRYAEGPERLRSAIESVPEEARKWRPAEGKWSAHEVVCHCADAETVAAMRIRYVLCEADPLIHAYDQEKWARALDYHAAPLDPSLETVRAVRAHTAEMLRRLPDEAWSKRGRHSETGPYGAEDWLRIYAEHVHRHSEQIERNLAAWRDARPAVR